MRIWKQLLRKEKYLRGMMYNGQTFIEEVEFYSSTYNILTIIDFYDADTAALVERKNKIDTIYPGYVYQLYAQYFALKDNGIEVKQLILHSLSDDITYNIPLPENDINRWIKFEQVLYQMRHFNVQTYYPDNKEKCTNCIYTHLCDRSLYDR